MRGARFIIVAGSEIGRRSSQQRPEIHRQKCIDEETIRNAQRVLGPSSGRVGEDDTFEVQVPLITTPLAGGAALQHAGHGTLVGWIHRGDKPPFASAHHLARRRGKCLDSQETSRNGQTRPAYPCEQCTSRAQTRRNDPKDHNYSRFALLDLPIINLAISPFFS